MAPGSRKNDHKLALTEQCRSLDNVTTCWINCGLSVACSTWDKEQWRAALELFTRRSPMAIDYLPIMVIVGYHQAETHDLMCKSPSFGFFPGLPVKNRHGSHFHVEALEGIAGHWFCHPCSPSNCLQTTCVYILKWSPKLTKNDHLSCGNQHGTSYISYTIL